MSQDRDPDIISGVFPFYPVGIVHGSAILIARAFRHDDDAAVLGLPESASDKSLQLIRIRPVFRNNGGLGSRGYCAVLGEETPKTVEEKKAMVLRRGVAMWDTIGSCEIVGSSDASITNVVPNDLSVILDAADIRAIFCNGGTSYACYKKYCRAKLGREAVQLPSTSPANARWTKEKLIEAWGAALKPYLF